MNQVRWAVNQVTLDDLRHSYETNGCSGPLSRIYRRSTQDLQESGHATGDALHMDAQCSAHPSPDPTPSHPTGPLRSPLSAHAHSLLTRSGRTPARTATRCRSRPWRQMAHRRRRLSSSQPVGARLVKCSLHSRLQACQASRATHSRRAFAWISACGVKLEADEGPASVSDEPCERRVAHRAQRR